MQKILVLLVSLVFISPLFAQVSKHKPAKKSAELNLMVSELKHIFSETQNKNIQLNKTIKLEMDPTSNNLVMSKSEILGNYPSTQMIVVKYLGASKDKKHIGLQFNLLNYSYHAKGIVLPQPTTFLKIGEATDINVGPYHMKITAKFQNLA